MRIQTSTYGRAARRRVAALAVLAGAALAGACSQDKLLEASDPDIIDPSAVQNAEGADGLRLGAFTRFTTALTLADAAGEGYFLMSGLLADEWRNTNSFTQQPEIDGRAIRRVGNVTDNSAIEQNFRNLNRARVGAIVAVKALRQYRPTLTSQIAQMYLLKGYAELYMAEGYCNGVTFGDASGDTLVFGAQLTTQDALKTAQATLDTALAIAASAPATDTLAVRVRPAAQIGRGRVLLGRALYDSAAAAVAGVASTFAGFNLTYSQTSGDNGVWSMNNNQRRYAVGDSVDYELQGGRVTPVGETRNAIPFINARDPRVQVTLSTSPAFVTTYPSMLQQVFPTRETTIPIANGIDARLIEAEAALASGTSAAYVPILNTLRSTFGPTTVPTGYTNVRTVALTDPGTATGRVNQFFREKAFWQFSRGYRLGDLRRLVRQYGRDQATVYPSGRYYYNGGNYGTDVVLPLPQAEQNANKEFKGCLNFDA